MRIVVLGAGAMGSLFGGYLSQKNDVYLIDVSEVTANAINEKGLTIEEPSGARVPYSVHCYTSSENLPVMDLIIVFVKAMYSKAALEANKRLIGKNTLLLTLQNGAGHEELLSSFVDSSRVIFGTTQHNAAVIEPGFIKHGGTGHTYIGRLDGNISNLDLLVSTFNEAGFEASASASVNHMVWQKLFTNVSASALTGVLQVPLGFILNDEHAKNICEELIREAVNVARAEGEVFDEEEEIKKVFAVCEKSPDGITSIYADIKNGRRTEVDTISGSVVRKATRLGVSAPYHRMLVDLIHAMENRR